jgi:hypothetical protein
MGQGQRVAGALKALRRWWRCAALLAVTLPAAAHQGGLTGYADIQLQGTTVRYTLTLSQLPSNADALVASTPSGPDLSKLVEAVAATVAVRSGTTPCPAVGAHVQPPGPGQLSTKLGVVYKCPQEPRELVVRDDSFDVIGADLHTLAKVTWPGGEGTFAFATEQREAHFAVSNGAAAPTSAGSFFLLGIEHILSGYDHLLFLAALLVRAQSWLAVLKVVTAFTLAHSLTLALAVLGIVTPPERLVEAVIALSIAWVAASNLYVKRDRTGRWIASLLFGLVHGLGFSAVLREMALPRDGLAWLLLQFNLGVETGQALAAAVALAVLAWVRTRGWSELALRFVSYSILAAGLLLLAERAMAVERVDAATMDLSRNTRTVAAMDFADRQSTEGQTQHRKR